MTKRGAAAYRHGKAVWTLVIGIWFLFVICGFEFSAFAAASAFAEPAAEGSVGGAPVPREARRGTRMGARDAERPASRRDAEHRDEGVK